MRDVGMGGFGFFVDGNRDNRVFEETSAVAEFFWVGKFGTANCNYGIADIFQRRIDDAVFSEFFLDVAVTCIDFMVPAGESECNRQDDVISFFPVFEY